MANVRINITLNVMGLLRIVLKMKYYKESRRECVTTCNEKKEG
jgi:hypothetical protein